VFSVSRRNASSHCFVREQNINARRNEGHTHHDAPVEALLPNSDYQVGTNPFGDLTSTDQKAVRVPERFQTGDIYVPPRAAGTLGVTSRTVRIKLGESLLPKCDTLVVGKLLDRVRLASTL